MRTTIDIDDDVLQAARSLAAAESRSIGKVLSDLARRGLAPTKPTKSRSGFPVFEVSRDAPPITLDMVRDALDDEA
jgi:hypothetical protein